MEERFYIAPYNQVSIQSIVLDSVGFRCCTDEYDSCANIYSDVEPDCSISNASSLSKRVKWSRRLNVVKRVSIRGAEPIMYFHCLITN